MPAFVKGCSIAIGMLGITIMTGLTRMAKEIEENGSCEAAIFSVAEDPRALLVELGKVLTAIMSNVEENLEGIPMMRFFQGLEAAMAAAEVEAGATVN
jgi:hypothetical protein